MSRIEAWTAAPKAQPTENMRKGRVEFMTTSITSFMDNLKQIFGLVYSDTPTESYEESEEYEDWALCESAAGLYKSVPRGFAANL